MKKLVLVAGLMMGLAVGSLAFSQGAAQGNNDAKRIDDLVQQLGSYRYVERERAQKELEALGDRALEALRKAAREGDLEVSRRAAEMVRRLEDRLTTSTLLAPKKVNLKLKDVPVTEAVAELAKQSGYPVNLEGDRAALAQRKITLETGEVSFWEALDRLCVAANLTEKTAAVPTPPIRPPIRPLPVQPGVLPVPVPKDGVKPKPPILKAAPVQLDKEAVVPAPVKAVPAQAAPVQAIPVQAEVELPAQAAPAQPAPAKAPAKVQPAPPVQIQVQAIQAVPVPWQMGQGLVVARPGIGGPLQITLSDGKPPRLPTSYAGSVRVRLLPASRINAQSQPGEALLVFEATPEPRLVNFQVLGNPSIAKVVDDQGQTLKLALEAPPAGDPNVALIQARRIAMPWNPFMGARPIPVRVKLGDKQATMIKELTGTLTAQVQLPPEPLLVLDKVLQGQGKTAKGKDGGSLTVQAIEKTGNNEYKVQMTVENANQQNAWGGIGGNFQVIGNAQIQIQVNGAPVAIGGGDPGIPTLLDAQGKAYQVTQIPQRSFQVNNGMARQSMTVVFRANSGQGEPERLVVTGSRMTNISIPFAFKDVPLP